MTRKVSIFGAAGTVGSCSAFSIAAQGLADELVLFDTDVNLATAHQMDLETAAMATHDVKVRIGTNIEEVAGSGVVIVAASAPWRQVSSRMQLLIANQPIIEEIAHGVRSFCPKAIVINATNPVDVLNWLFWWRSGLSRQRCLGYCLNDSLRARGLIAKALQIPAASIDAVVIGEHGDRGVMVSSSICVYGRPVEVDLAFREKIEAELSNVLPRFEALGTGRTTGWTSAVGLSRMIRSIFQDSHEMFPCSMVLDGEYGRSGISACVPIKLGSSGAEEHVVFSMTSEEEERLGACFDNLQVAIDSLQHLT